MKKIIYAFLYFSIVLFCFSSCKDNLNKKVPKSLVKFTSHGRFLVKETYDTTGKIKTRQYFNKDTIPDGAMIEYYSNGLIAFWQWYSAKYKNPHTGIQYNSKGIFDTLMGDTFLDVICCGGDNYVIVKMINPPQTGIRLFYKDSYKGKIINSIIYKPILTDTISWVPLDKYEYNKSHKYEIYFYVVDTITRTLFYQDSLEIRGGKAIKKR